VADDDQATKVPETQALKQKKKAKPKPGKKANPCGKYTIAGGNINDPYSLPGPQVEPTSAFWTIGPNFLHVVPVSYVQFKYTENPSSPFFLNDGVDYPRTKAAVDAEIAEIATLAATGKTT
jgi:hypothetical protein